MNKEYRDWIVRFGAKPGEYVGEIRRRNQRNHCIEV